MAVRLVDGTTGLLMIVLKWLPRLPDSISMCRFTFDLRRMVRGYQLNQLFISSKMLGETLSTLVCTNTENYFHGNTL